MKGFIIALQFMTRLPMPRLVVSDAEFAASMRWFPATGLVVGLIVAAAAWTGLRIDSWVGALCALAAWIFVTGALHLDGLADMADASGAAHKSRDRILEVLADPHVGSFGVVALVLQLLAKLVLLHALLDAALWPALILIPFAARIGPLAWTRWLPPLHEGLAARFRTAIRLQDLLLWVALLVGLSWGVPALLATPLLIALWDARVKHLLGGINGDAHGAGIELVETGLLAAALIAGRL